MPASNLLTHLAWACAQTRRHADVKPQDIAHHAHVDPSTVYRFEHARAYPQDLDALLDAYAHLVGSTVRDIVALALQHWPA